MGVLNITPDSFSDGRPDLSPDALLPLAEAMLEAGADLLDVGGESTRPGAAEVAGAVEIGRVVPVIHAIKSRLAVRISVDTRKAEVARAAIDAGADMINDVTALSDASMGSIAARARVPVVLMHMRGTPRTMQVDTHYDDLMGTLIDYLGKAADRARAAGVADDKILVDPGIGFGKSPSGSLQILRELPALGRVGRPIVIGASRKSFIGATLGLPVDERLEGSLAVAALAAWQGAHVIRVHDVAATARVVRMVDSVRGVSAPGAPTAD
jgi:dihydropteroate synthase